MRIHIIGGPGSGKTTLAKLLAARLNISFYELDVIGWESGVGPERSLEDRLRDVARIAAQPDWVTEGGPVIGWTDELLRAADTIVWLDLPWRIAGWRIVMRHMRTSLAGTNRHRGFVKLMRFLRSSRVYYVSTRPEDMQIRMFAANYLRPYRNKLVRCRRPADVKRFFDRVVSQEV